MAKLVLKKPAASTGVEAVLKKFQKDYGDDVGSFGGSFFNSERIPTGILALDLAMGGGFPRGRCSIIYGPESSNKTNIVLKAIGNHQKTHPHLTNVFFDIENAFDPQWAKKLGVNTDKLVVVKPSFAEQAVDMAENFLYADDIGIVAIDSLAALVTANEYESSAEKAVVGGSSNPIGKMCRKTSLALSEASKQDKWPTLIYINQTRFKIGVMFGDPETMPGGNAPRFQTSMWLRVYGKNVADAKVHQHLPVAKEVKFIIKKWKVPITQTHGEFVMATMPHKGMNIGDADDYSIVETYYESMGLLGKNKNTYFLDDQEFPTKKAIKERFYSDYKWRNHLCSKLLDELMSDTDLPDDSDGLEDED